MKSPVKSEMKFTKTGQPYVIDLKTGKARFIKKEKE